MERTYWHKQTPDKPLHPDLLWSRPENKLHAGKLLVVGGHKYGFSAPAEAYAEAERAGAGLTRVLLPLAVKSLVGNLLETVEYAMQNPSGGFSQMGLGELLEQAAWADGVLLAGDFGRNSETAILLEKFLAKHDGQVTITKDAADYFTSTPRPLLERPDTTLVVSLAQLQKIGSGAHWPQAFTFDMDLLRLVDGLHEFTGHYACNIVVKHLDAIFVAANGQVSTTRLSADQPVWRVRTAAHAAVWWLQNPSKPFEALTTAVAEASSK